MYVLILVGANKADYSTDPQVGLPVDQWRKRPCRARGNKTTHAAVSLGFQVTFKLVQYRKAFQRRKELLLTQNTGWRNFPKNSPYYMFPQKASQTESHKEEECSTRQFQLLSHERMRNWLERSSNNPHKSKELKPPVIFQTLKTGHCPIPYVPTTPKGSHIYSSHVASRDPEKENGCPAPVSANFEFLRTKNLPDPSN